MRQIKKVITSLIVTMVLLSAGHAVFAGTAYGAAGSDFSREGSITVTVHDIETGNAVAGETLTLYLIAESSEGGFALTDTFAESGIDPAEISASDAAAREAALILEKYVTEHRCQGKASSTGQSGQIAWDHVKQGLYLVTNPKSAEGYASISSFLVTVPQLRNGTYVYDITAKPKVHAQTPADPLTPDTPSGQGTEPGASPVSPNPVLAEKLPQTGQLWWPVPALSLAGILLALTGWRGRKGEKSHGQA